MKRGEIAGGEKTQHPLTRSHREWLTRAHATPPLTPLIHPRRVTELCEREKWFGRGAGSFRLFQQSLVPVVCAGGGKWAMDGPGAPALKPGGHGVIWKLAQARETCGGKEKRKAPCQRGAAVVSFLSGAAAPRSLLPVLSSQAHA